LTARFVKICYFVTVFMHDYTNQFNMKWKKKSTWRQKSGRTSNYACPLCTKCGTGDCPLCQIGSTTNVHILSRARTFPSVIPSHMLCILLNLESIWPTFVHCRPLQKSNLPRATANLSQFTLSEIFYTVSDKS